MIDTIAHYQEELEVEENVDTNPFTSFVITQSSKGIKYINSPSVMIGDIDVPKCFSTKNKAIESVESFACKYNMVIRIYETENGIRFFVMDRLFNLRDPLFKQIAQTLLTEVGCDPLYLKCLLKYERYAARLTPKHATDFTGIRFIKEVDCRSEMIGSEKVVEALELINKHDSYLFQFNWSTFVKQCFILFFDHLFSLR